MPKQSNQENRNIRKRSRYKKVYNHKRSKRIHQIWMIGCCIILGLSIFGAVLKFFNVFRKETPYYQPDPQYTDGRPCIDVQLLTPNEYSRPGISTEKIKGIVIHYVGNPGSTAQGNRDYFDGLKDSHETYASSHFVVGLDGEIIQCVPTNEIAYCSNSRNIDTVSIEVCHETEDGKFNEKTYASLVHLTGWLCTYLDISYRGVIRHYDVTGKICPNYSVEHEEAWDTFLEDVKIWLRSEKHP